MLDVADLFRVDNQGNPDVNGTLPRSAHLSDLKASSDGAFVVGVADLYDTVLNIPVPHGFSDLSLIKTRKTRDSHDIEKVDIVPGTDLVLAYRPLQGAALVSVLDFASDEVSPPVAVRKGVKEVHVSPSGEMAIIVHTNQKGDPYAPGIPLETRIARSPGYTLLHPRTLDLKLQTTETAPTGIGFVPDGSHAFVLFSAASVPYRSRGRESRRSAGEPVRAALPYAE